ncbi:chromosome segregation protein ParM [Streptomyces sp. ME19-01-6]|uniref:chromosome segregation protein ParM n=1 Tax=Streptomyces sp. ME19-01-6 TaxID=3028686 RepID=UPI0029AA9288|nr:chromosome segregation protein ParM [Streptomyces sp. ME19-01-6]MDX3232520.1 chromosome segregation protein ParM [Streptomyces sp. ME19-01-6]
MSVIAWRTPRSVVLERWGYVAAAPVLVVAPNASSDGTVNGLILTAGAAATAWAAKLVFSAGHDIGRALVRLSPLVSALAIDIAAMETTGWGWDALMAGGWTMLGCLLSPLSKTSRRGRPARVAIPQLVAATPRETPPQPVTDQADNFLQDVRHLWARAGMPGRTIVVHAHRHEGMPHDFTMMLRASEEGRPITGLNEVDVAAAFEVEPEEVEILPVKRTPGRPSGPGWTEVHITPDAAARPRKEMTDAQWWDLKVGHAKGPVPGTKFVRKGRDRERGFTYWIARTTDGGEPMWSTPGMCAALSVKPEDNLVQFFDDGDQVMVQVWDVSPLSKIYPATRELLTPGPDGRYVIGFLENGQPARNRVYTPRGAAHDMYIAPSGGGKTELIGAAAAAYANWGAIVMVAAESPDGKTRRLAEHVSRLGYGALFMVRLLRALIALMDIRGEMQWADGGYHDWSPDAEGCPYLPLKALLDEYLTATRHPLYGAEITNLAEQATVKGRKYAIGLGPGAQSAEVQDGFTRLMAENIRENSIPVLLRTPPGRLVEEFKALGFPRDKIPEPLPRTFTATKSTGRFDRIMKGEAEPPADPNTGGVGWIIEGNEAPRLRTLQVFVPGMGIDHLFPDLVAHLTDHEIRELEKRGVWFDWTLPPQPGEFGDDEDEDEDEGATRASGKGKRGKKSRRRGAASTAGSAALAEAGRMMDSFLED